MNAKVTDTAPDVESNTQEPHTASAELDSLLQSPVSLAHGSSGHTVTEEPQVIEADVDGRRVRIVAREEIVLECGNASITLRRNGRIIIKGTYVETCSEGTNRIKGGQVRIN